MKKNQQITYSIIILLVIFFVLFGLSIHTCKKNSNLEKKILAIETVLIQKNEALNKDVESLNLLVTKLDQVAKDSHQKTETTSDDTNLNNQLNNPRRPSHSLNKLDTIYTISSKDPDFNFYSSPKINFYYPNDFYIKNIEIDNIWLQKDPASRFRIKITSKNDFINFYYACMENNFIQDCLTTYAEKIAWCPDDFSLKSLEKILSGNYFMTTNSSQLPSNSGSGTKWTKIQKDYAIDIYIDGELLLEELPFYSKEKHSLTEEDLSVLAAQGKEYMKIFPLILKTFNLN